jgi:copper chaperone CopZ
VVEGMRCQGCAHHLRTQLLQVPGVQHVSVDFSTKQVSA